MGGDWKEMLTAAENNDLALVQYHIETGIDPNYQHPELLTTPLIESALAGHFEIVAYLLEIGAKPEIKGAFDGLTALDVAKIKKHKKIIQLLETTLGLEHQESERKRGFSNPFLDSILSFFEKTRN
jgi:ankyrin repeat protein